MPPQFDYTQAELNGITEGYPPGSMVSTQPITLRELNYLPSGIHLIPLS